MEQQLGMIAVKKTKLLGALSEFDHSDKVEADLEFILRNPQQSQQKTQILSKSTKSSENGFSRDQINRAPIKRAHKSTTQQYHHGMRLTTKSTNL